MKHFYFAPAAPTSLEQATDLKSHLAMIWSTLRLLLQSQLDIKSPQGQELVASSIESTLYLLSLLDRPSAEARAVCDNLASPMLAADLKQALPTGRVLLHYQPVFALGEFSQEEPTIVGVEALLRWHHPSQGWIPPSEFIPAVECTPFIYELGSWVLREACLQMQQWHQQGWGSLRLNVNVSVRQLEQPDWADQVATILAETGLAPDCLTLELTESIAAQNFEATSQQLAKLRSLGIQIGLDDFGTGYSSLSCLDHLPLDTLKIDRSFVSQERWEILKFIVLLASKLGLTVVAEGIETWDQLKQLRSLGCGLGQGYLFSPPLAPHLLERLLKKSELQPPRLGEITNPTAYWRSLLEGLTSSPCQHTHICSCQSIAEEVLCDS